MKDKNNAIDTVPGSRAEAVASVYIYICIQAPVYKDTANKKINCVIGRCQPLIMVD